MLLGIQRTDALVIAAVDCLVRSVGAKTSDSSLTMATCASLARRRGPRLFHFQRIARTRELLQTRAEARVLTAVEPEYD